MKRNPLVSVIMIFLNAEMFIHEAIESVLAQTYRGWELILVDDGSSDGSTATARRYARGDPGKIRYVEHPCHENRGMSASRNVGIAQSCGEYVTFLDADDVWLPYALERQIAIFARHPEAGMIYGPTEYWYSWTGAPEDGGRDRLDFRPGGEVAPGRLVAPPNLLTHFLRDPGAVPCICSLMVRRTHLVDAGGFEDAFRGLYEDQVMLAKIALRAPVSVAGEHWARYRQHPGSSCSKSTRDGQSMAARAHYLDWLTRYLVDESVHDAALARALRRQRMPYDHPSLHAFSRRLYSGRRRIRRATRRIIRLAARPRALVVGGDTCD